MQKEVDNLDTVDPEAMKEVENDMRGRAYLNGNVRGNAPTSDEVLAKFDTRQRIRQQKLGNISQYLSGTPISTQFQSLSGAQQGASPYSPTNYQPGINVNPNAGAGGAQFALGAYGINSGNVNAQNNYALNAWQTSANRPNPWMQIGGMALGAGASLGGAALL